MQSYVRFVALADLAKAKEIKTLGSAGTQIEIGGITANLPQWYVGQNNGGT